MLALLGPLGSNVETVITPESVGIYILCGGASSRMGQCKTTIEVHGQTMLTRILETIAAIDLPTFLVGKPSQQNLLSQYQIPWISDKSTTYHPLNGIVTALEHAQTHFDSTLFLPCDTPFLSSDCVLKLLLDSPSVAVDPSGSLHPLLLHIPTSWMERANRYLSAQRSMKAFSEPASLVELPHDSLRNLNNPSDLPTSTR